MGRKKLPRDKNGVPMGKNYDKKTVLSNVSRSKTRNTINVGGESTQRPPDNSNTMDNNGLGDSFLQASENIKRETQAVLAEQKGATGTNPPPESSASASPKAQGSTKDEDLDFQWEEIFEPVIDGAGQLIAYKFDSKALAFTELECKKLSKAYGRVLDEMFPDMSALTPKEKALLIAFLTTGFIAQGKIVAYRLEKAEKLEQKPPQPQNATQT